MFSVCEYHSLCWRDVLRPSWKHYFSLKASIKPSGRKALSGAALNVYPGRVMALVGENGAGKSTMMKVFTGIYTRDAGTLLWLGKETTFTGPKSSQ